MKNTAENLKPVCGLCGSEDFEIIGSYDQLSTTHNGKTMVFDQTVTSGLSLRSKCGHSWFTRTGVVADDNTRHIDTEWKIYL